jgi:hypothetical protein
METDDVAAILAGIRERQSLVSDASLGWTMEERVNALTRIAYEDEPRLLAAVEAVLKLGDRTGMAKDPDLAGYVDVHMIRRAITAALTGEETPRG